MIITGVKKTNENIILYTSSKIISFNLYKNDTPEQIIKELVDEGFEFLNLDYLKKLLKIVLYSRFTSIVNRLSVANTQ